ncbi:MAG: choice-of-anchor L domain-containing protein [Proteobacteria bacterium]|nr:choice-of-anchor L domain-containing protein [Pseudomonadota bacterium]
MNRLWIFLVTALCLAGCADETNNIKQPTQTPIPQDPDPAPEPFKPLSCDELVCPYGCCDAQCVDLRSDPTHCGRCDTVCSGFCLNGTCVTECSGPSARICAGTCVDIASNNTHCGGCDNACGPHMECQGAQCACTPGYSDCDGNAYNGCESFTPFCQCTNGETTTCYPGPAGTENVGICRQGIMTCEDGMFSYCENFVEPVTEIPMNGLDDDCDGITDEQLDEDNDGYVFGYGPGFDCCDGPSNCKAVDPSKINPGAIEDPANGLDDDCDGIIDEDDNKLCSTQAHKFAANTALTPDDATLLAQAMDICATATESSGSGLISAELRLADGSQLPVSGNKAICGNTTLISPAEQVAVATDLGGIVRARKGTMAVLASGKAMGKENTGYKDCAGTEVLAPQRFLNAHNGVLPVSDACYDPQKPPTHKRANDSVMLRLKLRAPSNAKGFKFRFKFFSKEYPKYVCNNYNDFFLAMTDAQSDQIPADGNISFDMNKNPVSVNNAFFTECNRSACTASKGCSDCNDGAANVLAYVTDDRQAGATDWLQTSVPVSPNEVFTLDLIIFDAGDYSGTSANQNGWGHQRDSLVLIDDFEWATEATQLITIVN